MKNSTPTTLLIVPIGTPETIIGLRGVANRMPAVLRLPGEPLAALARRALHQVRGYGPLVVLPMIRAN